MPHTTPIQAPAFPSRLPGVGTTIFTVMSALAAETGAVNLGQGFPDFGCDPKLTSLVNDAMREGLNQYPPMSGVAPLRAAISGKIERLYGHRYDAEREITVTAGGTQAIFTAVLCCAGPGDEVIVLDPCYDCYVPAIKMAGARAVRVPLTPGTFRPDFGRIAAALTPRTRLLISNTPHNPGGAVWSSADMRALQDMLASTAVLLLSDEVYEHMVYDGARHESVARYPGLAARAFIISSFGKTYHVTGWKIGYVAAPAALTDELRKVHQFNVFTVNTPMQHGIARYLQDPAPYLNLSAFYTERRERLRAALARTRLRLLPCQGTYFQCAAYDGLSIAERDLNEADFCLWLTREIGVAAVPLSAFYGNAFDQKIIRFCFAKRNETLDEAARRLARL
ncbi:MAG: pyridoxal phosphate-dependent aminotransferase [Burkholderiaceae bacterium]|jgi:methionine aminotransferase|nr:pyridoxal phosphate-dependent aminotransferase [Burkholderiaceae bacterium]